MTRRRTWLERALSPVAGHLEFFETQKAVHRFLCISGVSETALSEAVDRDKTGESLVGSFPLASTQTAICRIDPGRNWHSAFGGRSGLFG